MLRKIVCVLLIIILVCNCFAFAVKYDNVQKIDWKNYLVSFYQDIYTDAEISSRVVFERTDDNDGMSGFAITIKTFYNDYELSFTTWEGDNPGYVETVAIYFDVDQYVDDSYFLDEEYVELVLMTHYFFLLMLDDKNNTNMADVEFEKSAQTIINYYYGYNLDDQYTMFSGFGDVITFCERDFGDSGFIHYVLDMRDIYE